jgi:hypothetical protein
VRRPPWPFGVLPARRGAASAPGSPSCVGRRTFAQHVDRIGATPEAKELVDSTRSSVSPVLEDATDRMLGEYIEAPTQAPPGAAAPARTKPGTDAREPPGSRAARRVPSHGEGSVPARAGR